MLYMGKGVWESTKMLPSHCVLPSVVSCDTFFPALLSFADAEVRDYLAVCLTVTPRAQMAYESERNNNCFSKIQLPVVGQKSIEPEHLSQVKARHQSFFTAKTLLMRQALFATSGL